MKVRKDDEFRLRAYSELVINPTGFNEQFDNINIILYIYNTWLSYWKYFIAEVQNSLVGQEARLICFSFWPNEHKLLYMHLSVLILKSPSMCFL